MIEVGGAPGVGVGGRGRGGRSRGEVVQQAGFGRPARRHHVLEVAGFVAGHVRHGVSVAGFGD